MTEKGQSLFEVVLSLAVITIITVALIILATNSIRNANFSRTRTVASRHVQETTEWLRGERDAGWDSFETRALTPQYCLPSLSWDSALIGGCGSDETVGDTILRREVFFEVLSPTLIETQVVVYWEDAQGQHEVRSITNFTDWRAQ